ncbi:hypothetical protein CBS101457_005235 [Exobasidium rhododendri]|nr:hypothetical protein CBS101457_005235 [Exobasidium rhododendri]
MSANASNTVSSEPTPDVSITSLFSLKGKHVLLTGGNRGIGAACALAFSQAGASCCLVVRPGHEDANTSSHPSLKPLASSGPDQRHCCVEADLSDMAQVKTIVDKTLRLEEMQGRIDVLVNCGGIQRRSPATEFTEEDWDDVLNVNLKAVFFLCQAAGRHMLQGGGGKIINFCSLLSYQGGLTVPAYASSKAAVANLTRSLSNEWAKLNINVNGIAPGYIATDMNEKLLADPTRLRQISERIPAGRWGQPQDFAGPVVFLASDASKYVNGEILVVDGGWMGR